MDRAAIPTTPRRSIIPRRCPRHTATSASLIGGEAAILEVHHTALITNSAAMSLVIISRGSRGQIACENAVGGVDRAGPVEDASAFGRGSG